MLRRFWQKMQRQRLISRCQSVGTGVEIDLPVRLIYPEKIQIGSYVYLGPWSYLNGRGGLTIQDHVIMAPDVAIMTSMHRFREARLVPYDEVELLKPVIIEAGVWIGMRALILPGVTLGEGSIVGAGAVVTKSCAPGTILAGNPANAIGIRDMDHFAECMANDAFYLKTKQQCRLEKVELPVAGAAAFNGRG
ncbi:MAG: acyltransferase [Armatimonadota bacterium]